jgi:hypothetical protein
VEVVFNFCVFFCGEDDGVMRRGHKRIIMMM